METLEAEVRSKFQTKRRMKDAEHGTPVDVPFDETIVKYLWTDVRTLEIISVELA